MQPRLFFFPAVMLLLCTPFAHGHHNATSHYELDKSIVLEGVVTKFRMTNPHAQLYFDVEKESGEVQHWVAEGNSVGVLLREGFSRDALKPGDKIKLTGRPSRNGLPRVLWTTITKSDGLEEEILYGGNSISTFSEEGVPEDVQDHLETLRQRQIQEREKAAKGGDAEPPDEPDEEGEKEQPTQSY